MNQPSILSPEHLWFLREWGSALATAIESMGADRPQVSEFHLAADASAESSMDADACRLIYTLSIVDGPALGVAASDGAWKEIATRVLTGVGMEKPTPQLCLETYRELVGQSCSALAQSLTSRLGKEVAFAAAQDAPWPPEFTPVAVGNAQFGTQPPVALYVHVSVALVQAIANLPSGAHRSDITSTGRPALEKLGTLENLEMGVTMSLGTARISLGDALALGAGSVVLLSSALDDLVVVKVDGKVIARGELVVVDNSYAIRIIHLASKDERFSGLTQMQTTLAASGSRLDT